MNVPQELEQLKTELKQYETSIHDVLYRLESFRVQNSRFDEHSDLFHKIDTEIREALGELSEVQRYFGELFAAIERQRPKTTYIVYFEDSSSTSMYGTYDEVSSAYPNAIKIDET